MIQLNKCISREKSIHLNGVKHILIQKMGPIVSIKHRNRILQIWESQWHLQLFLRVIQQKDLFSVYLTDS